MLVPRSTTYTPSFGSVIFFVRRVATGTIGGAVRAASRAVGDATVIASVQSRGVRRASWSSPPYQLVNVVAPRAVRQEAPDAMTSRDPSV
ncbi:hypothetical protein LUX57_09705 [Actinomadura madurae]|uniref:hypothetical protein n=1 Tax=Actinomadura madurae TaxID=1993 RepID=UPI0020D2192E|nr:hypothetical protein [Actinomadura madurae]MCP9965373.1 hypothetical protein [Actinomadura madurae]